MLMQKSTDSFYLKKICKSKLNRKTKWWRFEIYAEEHWIYEDLHSVIEPHFETFPNGEQNSSSLLMQILICVLRQCWQFCPSCVSPIEDINRNIQQYDSRGGFCVFVIVWVAVGGYSTPGMVAFMYVVFVSNTVFVFIFVFLFVKRCCLSSVSSIQLPTALLLPPIVFIQHNAICLRWNHHSFVFFVYMYLFLYLYSFNTVEFVSDDTITHGNMMITACFCLRWWCYNAKCDATNFGIN